jgi:cytidine deaminase
MGAVMSLHQREEADVELIARATALAVDFRASEHCTAASVAAALVTHGGRIYTGVCIDTACGLGFCAEHAPIAEMLKARESQVLTIVAVNSRAAIMSPCGRCRELLWQVDRQNARTRVLLEGGRTATLADLLPYPAYDAK